ncbi:MAG: hypothetical protein EBS12_07095, partial [Flavobacteriia bacterium]|nr:hypothetical protein [Flavobacteriia bacterium]
SIEYWLDEKRLITIKIIEEIKITNQNLLNTMKRSCTLLNTIEEKRIKIYQQRVLNYFNFRDNL